MISARIARLNSDGSTDNTFDVGYGANGEVTSAAVTPNGQALVGGDFTYVDLVQQTRLSLRNTDGSQDSVFDLTANNTVWGLTPTLDGKVLMGGDFTQISGQTRNHSARMSSALGLEGAWNPNFDGVVRAMAVQEDGKVLAGGQFTTVGGESRANLVRLLNDTASSDITVESSAVVSWVLSGAFPQAERSTFELSTDGGMTWSPLGAGTPTSGGWQITGLSLSGTGQIRARAYPHSVTSQGIIEDTVSFDFSPEIQVEQPAGTILVDAVSTVAYGSVQLGETLDFEFVIRNIGLDDLDLTTPTQVALSGTNANQWSIVAQPSTPVVPGSFVTFTVTFDPTSTGSKTATLTILSNDSDEDTFTVSLTGSATPGPGSRDTTYQPVANNTVQTCPVDVDGRAFVAGAFTSLNGVARNRFGRLLSTGANDTSLSGTGANNFVQCAAIQSDGKIVIGGNFTSVNGVARNRIARLNEDGSLDTSFNPNSNSTVYSIDIFDSGGILVAGSFTTIAGSTRYGVAKLLSTGAIDSGFSPSVGSSFQTRFALIDASSRVLVSGNALRRLTTAGATDTTFGTAGDVSVTGFIDSLTFDAEGNIITGGSFTVIGGQSMTRFARLDDAGVVDTTFNCPVNGRVYGIQVQTDERILLAGTFSQVDSQSYSGVARSVAAGGEDTTFITTLSSVGVANMSVQQDGMVLVAGGFTFGGVDNASIARLYNNPAASELSAVSASEVQWLRSGTGPEARSVQFQYSQNGGTSWVSLGFGTRITGGWNLTGVSLPANGLLRSLARVTSGSQNGYASLLSEEVSFSGLAVADIQVEQPTNSILAEGNARQFTGVLVGQSSTLLFTIRNIGNATLSSLSAVTTNAAEFSIVSLGATSLAIGATTTLEVRFTPSTTGARQATLLISSNVPGDKNPFSVLLNGNGITTPLVTTLAAQSVTSTTALIRGSFTARADTASGYFQYRAGTSGAWIQIPVTPFSVVNQFNPQVITQGLTGLTPATLYQFRALTYNAVNGSGSPVIGATLSFTTS